MKAVILIEASWSDDGQRRIRLTFCILMRSVASVALVIVL